MEKRIVFDFSIQSVFKVVFGLILLWVLFYLRDILVLFFLAFILAAAIEPIVNLLGRRKIPRWATIIGIYTVLILFIYMLVRLIIPPMTEQINHFVRDRNQLAIDLVTYLDRAPEAAKIAIVNFINEVPEKVSKYSASAQVLDNALGVFSGILGLLTVLVIAFYLLIEKGSMENFVKTYWPQKSNQRALKIFKEIVTKTSYWARGQMVLSGTIGVLTFIGLTVLGVDYALTLALIAAITELLPLVGPFIGAFPAIIIAFAINPILALWVALLYFGIQQFENHVLVPQVMKKALGLSPVVIIFALLVGAKLLGILGIIISIPVASAVAVLVNSLKKKEA